MQIISQIREPPCTAPCMVLHRFLLDSLLIKLAKRKKSLKYAFTNRLTTGQVSLRNTHMEENN